jgi:hypothetical protein
MATVAKYSQPHLYCTLVQGGESMRKHRLVLISQLGEVQ